jgi:Tfp pilus assembly protein PilF
LEGKNQIEQGALGKKYFGQGDYEKAGQLLSKAIETNTSDYESFFYLANIFHIKGEIGKAIKAFKKVLELNPSHTDAAISLSVIYNDIGRYDDAKKVFQKADKRVRKQGANINGSIEEDHVNKKFSLKHFELADLYMTYNRYDEALFEYNKAISLDTSNFKVRVKIAKVYAKKGFVSKAFDELRKLKNEYPSYLPGRIALGLLYYSNGNILKAQAEWKQVLNKDPLNEEAKMYINLSETATETLLS